LKSRSEPELEVEESELDEMWSYVRKVIPDGCGMRLTAELGRYWLMCLAGVMTNRFSQKAEPFGIKVLY